MPIFYDEKQQIFHLQNEKISYIIGIEKNKYLVHRYWGERLESYHGSNEIQRIDRGFATNPFEDDRTFSLNSLPLEISSRERGDHRVPNFAYLNQHAQTATDFTFSHFKITEGKAKIPNLPTLRGETSEVTSLKLHLKDKIQELEIVLYYHLYEHLPIITRHVDYINNGNHSIDLENAGSMMLDISRTNFDFITLGGSHTNEANIHRTPLRSGIQAVESTRGTSSPQYQPFIALANKNTDEFSGEVFGFHLVYSGNFIAQAEVEQYGSTRVQMGIHPYNFSWQLTPKSVFHSPEVVLNYSNNGFNGMSESFHKLYQEKLIPKVFIKQKRPVLLNTWEANYFDIEEKELMNQAEIAKDLGIELFVLDDGWFGERNDDTSSLGDWYVNKNKLPHGLDALSDAIHDKGMKFGLWFEPEMISQNSDLFRQHPNWVFNTIGYEPIEGRRQLVLDLSREDVQDYLIEMLDGHLKSGKIDYIKWDMNRHLTDVGNEFYPPAQQGELYHRYCLGLYRILSVVTTKYPNVLFENCSSGGGRFDPGMMYYMAQNWTSDNTDALCRASIQYGYSFLYPPIMMTAHVSPVPNNQVSRITPLNTRGLIAMSGNFGYEMDVTLLEDDEKTEIKEQITFYKNHRNLFQFGKFYRLQAPDEYYASAWLFQNNEEVMVIYFNGLAKPAVPVKYLPLQYLDNHRSYKNVETGLTYSGSELNKAGVTIPRIKGDFETLVYHFTVE
ncbi:MULTISPECIES: alpha-galactosidase [Enterococcus]|nr:alpha-galactosidase [Enterococcus faecium]MDG4641214.1 alpha-galactosidase [Enterococcus faecium]MDK4439762.1 alpha-galactosidase [Enterococcus faecium]MDK4461713.1 alpha-galactosidase [Enterococcus faecium]MDT2301318.1 alpha-galactosidase [Enterococcus faecium]MDT2326436.1 alpha-galactosidase [Enterococcus faecium]